MLGVSFADTEPLCESIEAHWESYTGDDLKRFTPEEQLTWAELEALAYRIKYRDGEVFGMVVYDDAAGRSMFGTRLQLVDPDRVCNPNDHPDKPLLRNGIELNEAGRPIAAHILEAHPSDFAYGMRNRTWRRVPFYDAYGRPVLIHHADLQRPGQLRGTSRLAPVIKGLRSLNVFDDAELQSRVVNALFSAVLTTNWDPASAADAVSATEIAKLDAARTAHYKDNPVKNPFGGRISVLPAGDTLETLDTKRDTGEGFVKRVLHNIAAGAGVTYEQLTGDLSDVNYSSIRAGLLEIRRDFARDETTFAAAFWGPFYYAWLEEGFARGYFEPPAGAPDFHACASAYCRVRWVKPGRGYIDPVKEAQAAGIRMRLGVTTLEDECARFDGSDWRDKLRQQKRERQLRIELKLPVIPFADAIRANAATDKGEGGAAADDEFNQHDPDEEASA